MTSLLQDATKGCRHRDDCDALRLEADYLVLRLNLATGNRLWSETVHVGGERANATGLSGDVTLRQLVDDFEARAGHALSEREMRAWQSLL